ncbi:MAG: CHASE3 domain-containing protein [Bacteroidetes bacterium]|nr:CHASE3 domain-containing protein [Bacteroidota bacterium]
MKAVNVRSLLVLSVLLTVVSAIITYLNVLQKKDTTALVIHHYKVLQASTRLMSLLKDLELGHRGFLITSDTSFLAPYREALNEIELEVDTLQTLVRGNTRQEEILNRKLVPLVNHKKERLEQSISISRAYGRDSAAHYSAVRTSAEYMDSIRYWMLDFSAHEQEQLAERNTSLEQRYFINDVIRFGSFALIGITSLAALFTIMNKERDNKRLLQELQTFNQQLEQKVQERTHELQEANKDLIKLNEEKTHFLAITTHDLKAPLAGITGLLRVIRMDSQTLTPKQLEYVRLIEDTCDEMQSLISNLLDISSVEHGSVELQPADVRVPGLFNQLKDRFLSWASRKNIELEFVNKSQQPSLRTDHDILLRILDNLVSNAIKFSPSGSKVTIAASDEGTGIRFNIVDQGPGIKPDERSRLFNRFQRLSARPTEGESSSGLGLSISKELAGQLGGVLDLEKSDAQGSVFSVHVPSL